MSILAERSIARMPISHRDICTCRRIKRRNVVETPARTRLVDEYVKGDLLRVALGVSNTRNVVMQKPQVVSTCAIVGRNVLIGNGEIICKPQKSSTTPGTPG